MKLTSAIRSYLNSMAVERSLSANTLSAYRRDLDKYRDHLAARGVDRIDEVRQADSDAFIDYLSDMELADSSRTRTLVAARTFHAFAHAEGWTKTNPAEHLTLPQAGQRLPKALSIDEVTGLIEAADLGAHPLRDRALLEVLYGTGARISEVVGLDIDDVDTARQSVRVFGKGRKERVLPLGSYAIDAIEAYLVRVRPSLAEKGKGTPAMFLNTLGRRLSRQSAWSVIRGCAERAGISSHVTPHTLRHSYATHLLAGGADVRVVQELLGHSSVTTTQIYTAVTIDSLRESYATSHPRARKAR